MAVLLILLLLLLLVLLTGGILGMLAFSRQNSLNERLREMEAEIEQLRRQLIQPSGPESSTPAAPSEQPPPKPDIPEPPSPEQIPPAPQPPQPQPQPEPMDAWGREPGKVAADVSAATASRQEQSAPLPGSTARSDLLAEHLRRHWMIWLGGTCVGLAGIFMVRYSIEQGLLGPGGRIILSLLTGVVLHGLAEWLRQRQGQNDVFAALAGGASIVLYAALLASLHQLDYVPPGLVFAAMALVSVITLGLALVHGPLLAALGMLGGYLVPVLVDTGSQQIEGALIYSLILTISVLVLLRYVWRLWLWCGVVIGALAWWGLSWLTPPADEVSRTLYLFGTGWALLAAPRLDWLLIQKDKAKTEHHYLHRFIAASGDEHALLLALLLVCAAQSFDLLTQTLSFTSVWSQLLLPLLLLHAASRRALLAPLPGLLLMGLAAALLGQFLQLDIHGVTLRAPGESERDYLIALLALLGLLGAAFGSWNLNRKGAVPGIWSSTACLSPLLMLALAYLLLAELDTEWRWGGASLALGIGYLALARQLRAQSAPSAVIIALIASSHLAYSLAAVIWFDEATLTLALALQLMSLAAIQQRCPQPLIPWLIRLVIIAVGCRLTLNPWLATYANDTHWSLWTYGGSTLSCFIAAQLSQSDIKLRAWLQGAAATLLVLTLGTELRYWLYDGEIFGHRYSFTEASINTLIWGCAGLVYYWRAGLSQVLGRLYRFLAAALLLMATLNHLLIVLMRDNPLWGATPIAPTPIWNMLLLAYGAPVLLLLALGRFYRPRVRPWAMLGAGLSLLLFVSLEIRHLWQGAVSLALPTDNPELYTYSVVWLLMAAAGMTWAIRRDSQQLYRAAMALLFLDILKIFVIDMEGLDGLLRVASFMGLGLVLLLLAWIHQHLGPSTTREGQKRNRPA
ncbi:DUF2339 domain-containing protein [Marinobacterium sp. YM272]|uniref:DUF2339 domain-containing protein n=1 Tax=Marinobacterium sp. YM272 TaxID=3421654 RepID=UPI003D7FB6F5